MLSCQQASQIVSQSLDRPLTTRERFALKFHLLICKYCKNFSQQLNAMRVALKANLQAVEFDNTIEMPSEAKKRIAALVDAN